METIPFLDMESWWQWKDTEEGQWKLFSEEHTKMLNKAITGSSQSTPVLLENVRLGSTPPGPNVVHVNLLHKIMIIDGSKAQYDIRRAVPFAYKQYSWGASDPQSSPEPMSATLHEEVDEPNDQCAEDSSRPYWTVSERYPDWRPSRPEWYELSMPPSRQ